MKQPVPVYQCLIDKLRTKKEDGLLLLVKEQVECFFIDYKEVTEDFSGKKSLNNYWGILAKAISGFGNALGGILIFGVENKSKKLSPFLGYKNFESLINEFVSRSTNPKHENINTFSFFSKTDNQKGYVIVEIAQSENRPLQVISNEYNHRYFYRSGESHNDIPHDVLVGMLGYKIPPKLSYQIVKTEISSVENFEFEIILRNKSATIARNIWLNIDIGIPNVNVLESNFIDKFEGAKLNNACSLITKNEYRMPPQGLISVLRIQVPRAQLGEDKDYHFYFTYGCDGSKINEFNAKFSGKEFNKTIGLSLEDFIKFLQEKSPDHIIERL
jgi:predicted HTH transcriptional regulator